MAKNNSKFLWTLVLLLSVSFLGFLSAVSVSLVTQSDSYAIADPNSELVVSSSAGLLNNDPSRDAITTIYIVTNTTKGVLDYVNSDGSFMYYTNSLSFHGVDYFDYIASDGVVNSSVTRVWLGVNNSIVSSVLNDDYELVDASAELVVVASDGLLNNDGADPDGDMISIVIVKNLSKGYFFEFDSLTGAFTYITDSSSFHGVDYFDYVLSDGYANSDSARVVIGVDDSAPVALQDKYNIVNSVNTTKVTGVMVNDSDSDGDQMTAHIVKSVNFGKLTTTGFSVNGSFNYTANKSNGVDFFSYYVTDLFMNSSTVKCIFVIGTNTAPVATSDNYYYDLKNSSFKVNASQGVLKNDNDAESDVLFAYVVDKSGLNGSLIFNEAGSFTYYPKAGFKGIETFTYKTTDLDLESSVVSVNIYVNYTGITNLTDDLKGDMEREDKVTANFSSEIYPLTLSFELFNGSSLIDEDNYTASGASDLPKQYTIPSDLAVGSYTLYLSIYDTHGNLISRTSLGNFDLVVPSDTPATTGGGGGGTGSICTTQWSCTDWGACGSGIQTRTCSYNAGYCTPLADKPLTIQTCGVNNGGNEGNVSGNVTTNTAPGLFAGLTGAVIGTTAGKISLGVLIFLIFVGAAYWIVVARRRKEKPIKVKKMSEMKKK